LIKKILIIIIPIIISIIAISYSYQFVQDSQKNLENANAGVSQASINLLNACGDLQAQINSITVASGPGSEQLNQFIQTNSADIKSCQSSLQSIKDSCKSYPSMQACNDPRLEKLSEDFSGIHP
jgi:hypothetical protein